MIIKEIYEIIKKSINHAMNLSDHLAIINSTDGSEFDIP